MSNAWNEGLWGKAFGANKFDHCNCCTGVSSTTALGKLKACCC